MHPASDYPQPPSPRAPGTPASNAGRQGRGTGFLFLLATLVSMAALAATYYFFVRTTTGQFIDESALVEAVEIHGTAGKAANKLLDWLPALSLLIATVVVLFVTVMRRRWAAAGIAVAACVGANVATQILKDIVPVRPYRGIETLELNSLPSGHTTLAASAAAAVFLMVVPALASAGRVPGRQLRRRHRGVHPDQPVAPARRRRRGLPRGGGVYAPGGLADHPHGAALERLGRLRTSTGPLPGCGWRCRCWRGSPRPPSPPFPCWALAAGNGQEGSTTHYFWAGTSLIVIAGYLATVAGVWLFGHAARRRTAPRR